MKKSRSKIDFVRLPDTYRNVSTSGFTVVGNMLSDMTSALQKSASHTNDSNVTCFGKIQDSIQQMRKSIAQITNDLNLERKNEDIGSIVLSRCSKIWEVLCDLKTSRLKGYGIAPQGLSNYLNPRIDELLKILDQIIEDTKRFPHERLHVAKHKK